jgi:hypothetical protein
MIYNLSLSDETIIHSTLRQALQGIIFLQIGTPELLGICPLDGTLILSNQCRSPLHSKPD